MIVVADTSVLLNLCRVEQIDLLRSIFDQVVIPPEVATEFARLASTASRFHGLTLPVWIHQQAPTARALPTSAYSLHAGEIAALSLAIEIRADAILIDERAGHAVAQQLGLRTIGILGILLRAKADGHVAIIRPIVERLERDARFWLEPGLRERVFRAAGE